MPPEYQIVPYRDHHKEQVVGLQAHLWGPDPELNRAYFEWKYQQNPYIPEPTICLALHRGEVVGMRGVFGAKWTTGPGRSMVIPYTDDFVIAPEHRNQGLAPRLIHGACEYAAALGNPYLLSLRAGSINLFASLAAGYRTIGPMEPVGLPYAAGEFRQRMRPWLQRMPYLWRYAEAAHAEGAGGCFGMLDRAARRPWGGLPRQISLEKAPRPDAMAAFEARLAPDQRFRHVRDAEYFAWVCRNPRLEYRFLYWGREELEGYLMLHARVPPQSPRTEVWIPQWEAVNETVRDGLLDAAIRAGRFALLSTWAATCPDPVRSALEARGFRSVDTESRSRGMPAAIIRALQDADEDAEWLLEGRSVVALENWKFRLLDQD